MAAEGQPGSESGAAANALPGGAPVEGVPLIYMNWLRTVGTAGDIAIDVGYQVGNDVPVPSVRLAMTWEHAKLLYESIGSAIEQFEANNGPIRDLKKHLVPGPHHQPLGHDQGESR